MAELHGLQMRVATWMMLQVKMIFFHTKKQNFLKNTEMIVSLDPQIKNQGGIHGTIVSLPTTWSHRN